MFFITRVMKRLFFFILCMSIYTEQNAQNCNQNSQPNPNYCCGHDPDLVPGLHQVFNWTTGGINNFCDWAPYFDQQKNPTDVVLSTGDWLLIWNDDFDGYTKLDESFYCAVSQLAYNINDGGDAIAEPNPQFSQTVYMHDPDLIKINQGGNGKLQLFERYDPDPSRQYQLYNWGVPLYVLDPNNPGAVIPRTMHADYAVGHLETKFHFPINCRIQGMIKRYPMNKNQWPAFWTYGGPNTLELDIFEVRNNISSWPADYLSILTFHSAKWGNDHSQLGHEGVIWKPLPSQYNDLSADFHLYELIWTDWRTQWWFDHQPIRTINKYYKLYNDWSSNKRKKNYRRYGVQNQADFYSHSDQLFAKFRHYPGYDRQTADPQVIIFNNQIDFNGPDHTLDPLNIYPSVSMDMDYLRVWIKADCSSHKEVNSENINVAYIGQASSTYSTYQTNWVKRNYLETGGNIHFNNVSIDNTQIALIVATDEIKFGHGFVADAGSTVFAFISFCEASADNNTSTRQEDLEPEDDGSPYYGQNGEIDTTDLIALENQQSGGRLHNQEQNHGILETSTDASVNNGYMTGELVIQTSESGLTIVCTGGELNAVEVYDSKAGMIYKESHPQHNSARITRELIPPGVYTIIMYTSTGTDVRKVCVFY